jgi:hypothetical protein
MIRIGSMGTIRCDPDHDSTALYTNLQHEATSLAAAQDVKERKLAPLRAAYRGIYWDDAYEECSTEHFDMSKVHELPQEN